MNLTSEQQEVIEAMITAKRGGRFIAAIIGSVIGAVSLVLVNWFSMQLGAQERESQIRAQLESFKNEAQKSVTSALHQWELRGQNHETRMLSLESSYQRVETKISDEETGLTAQVKDLRDSYEDLWDQVNQR